MEGFGRFFKANKLGFQTQDCKSNILLIIFGFPQDLDLTTPPFCFSLMHISALTQNPPPPKKIVSPCFASSNKSIEIKAIHPRSCQIRTSTFPYVPFQRQEVHPGADVSVISSRKVYPCPSRDVFHGGFWWISWWYWRWHFLLFKLVS